MPSHIQPTSPKTKNKRVEEENKSHAIKQNQNDRKYRKKIAVRTLNNTTDAQGRELMESFRKFMWKGSGELETK